jgi:radical SAM protein with 4Fe4S-binding SPASM domain
MDMAIDSVETNYFRFVQWDITSKCNLSCIHCRSESFYGDSHLAPDLSLEHVRSRLDRLCRQGVRRIHFLGGEPFVRRDLASIVEYAGSLGILCSVNTNGTLITREVARAIVSAGTYLLTFSLDGYDATINDGIRGRGSFHKALRGLRHVQEAKAALRGHVRLVCSHTLMRPNHQSIAKMIDVATELGFQNLIVSSLRRMGAASRNYQALALSTEEQLEVGEAAARRLRGGDHCHVQYEALPILGKIYLNEKYGISLPVYRSGCDATTTKGFLQANGKLYPCQDTAPGGTAASMASSVTGDRDDWKSPIGVKIANALTNPDTYQQYTPCNRCPALGLLCVPCPLSALNGRKVTHTDCERIMQKAITERISLERGTTLAAGSSVVDTLLNSPKSRSQFFFGPDPLAALSDSRYEQGYPELLALRSRILGETVALVEAAVAQLNRQGTSVPSAGAQP